MSVLHIPVSPFEGEFAKADAVICGLYAEKAACKTCCLLLTCWAESVHPQSRKAWGSRLSGSIRLPGAPCVLMSLPKALQWLMSPLLAEIRESISRKGLALCWNETATHAQVPPWAKIYIYAHGEKVAQFTWQRISNFPTSWLLLLLRPASWCTRSTDLAPWAWREEFMGQISVTFLKLSPG